MLWSEEAKIIYQGAFHSNDVKHKLKDIDEQLEAGCMDVQSLTDNITDVIVLTGNKSCHLNLQKGKFRK